MLLGLAGGSDGLVHRFGRYSSELNRKARLGAGPFLFCLPSLIVRNWGKLNGQVFLTILWFGLCGLRDFGWVWGVDRDFGKVGLRFSAGLQPAGSIRDPNLGRCPRLEKRAGLQPAGLTWIAVDAGGGRGIVSSNSGVGPLYERLLARGWRQGEFHARSGDREASGGYVQRGGAGRIGGREDPEDSGGAEAGGRSTSRSWAGSGRG